MKKHKRKLLIPKVSETNLDNTFVSARQVDAAAKYLSWRGANMGEPVVCLSKNVLAKMVLERVKMPELPAHLRSSVSVVKKSRLAAFWDNLNWRNW